MEHVVELGKMGRDCVATDQLPLSRVCHCVTATMATLSSHPTTAELIMTCPNDIALSTLLLLVEVRGLMTSAVSSAIAHHTGMRRRRCY
jgi:hypothetical protein